MIQRHFHEVYRDVGVAGQRQRLPLPNKDISLRFFVSLVIISP